jgi:phytoene dehydrogenase-like protein
MLMARFGFYAIRSAYGLAKDLFRGERARALFAGLGGHSIQSLERPITAAFGMVMGISGHAVGWPVARGGSQKLIDALVAYLKSLGGEVITNSPIDDLDQLPSTRVTFLDITPRQFLKIAGERLPSGYRRQLERYRYGPGVFKIDYALDGPVPWKAPECNRAATVHLGGSLEEINSAEKAVWSGNHPERPFIILVQQTLFDVSRAPQGKHTVWAYAHIPNGSMVDISHQMESQIERFAPGFRDRVLARSMRNPIEMEEYNQNYIGGDINGGVQDVFQLFTRPTRSLVPYETPIGGVYLCSSSTPPGGGVHGMCGYFAVQAALNK